MHCKPYAWTAARRAWAGLKVHPLTRTLAASHTSSVMTLTLLPGSEISLSGVYKHRLCQVVFY